MHLTKQTNNRVTLSGTVSVEAAFDHVIGGENLYSMEIRSRRLSGTEDSISLLIPEKCFDPSVFYEGTSVLVTGELRSIHKEDEYGRHLALRVFVKTFEVLEAPYVTDINKIDLFGYTCREISARTTPGERTVADIFLAVNRNKWKSDYIPCICWEGNACRAEAFEMGTPLSITGRIQSREYTKQLSETEKMSRIIHEVSINGLRPYVKKAQHG